MPDPIHADPARAALEQQAGERRAMGAMFVNALAAGPDDAPPLAFEWGDVEGAGFVRLPVDPHAAAGAIAEYKRLAEIAATSTAAVEAELAAYLAADDVTRARNYTPDVRQALARRAATRSPI